MTIAERCLAFGETWLSGEALRRVGEGGGSGVLERVWGRGLGV